MDAPMCNKSAKLYCVKSAKGFGKKIIRVQALSQFTPANSFSALVTPISEHEFERGCT